MAPADPPAVSVIVVHYRRADLTTRLLSRLAADASAGSAEILVVDNCSPEALDVPPDGVSCRVIRNERNAGYAAACNLGARQAAGSVLLFCNNDISYDSDVLGPLLGALRGAPRPGIAGPGLIHPDGRFQLSWGEHPGLRSEWHERRRQRESRRGGGSTYDERAIASRGARDVDWLTGACFMVSREAFEDAGGFDEEYFFYFEDADFCRRVGDNGYSIRYHPELLVTHYGSSSAAPADAALTLSYRLGQLRYYSLHNTRISFIFLKVYLAVKLAAGPLRSALSPSDRTALLGSIRRFPWRIRARDSGAVPS